MKQNLWVPKLIEKYNVSGPRYTSYPTALEMHESFSLEDLYDQIKASTNKEISVYLHIPFCHTLCYYCGCNKIVSHNYNTIAQYVNYLIKEIKLKAKFFLNKKISQISWGGGTPSYLSNEQITEILEVIKNSFTFTKDIDHSIEIDPREFNIENLDFLKSKGINRLSFGVQDFYAKTQIATNRINSFNLINKFFNRAKEIGFNSINFDFIYGLPYQTVATFQDAIEKAILINPDRLSIFNYAHLPHIFPSQKLIDEKFLPNPKIKLEILRNTIKQLTNNDYHVIGMDHFAKKTDLLYKAQLNKTLHRNFQGYTTHGHCDLVGFGNSSISQIHHSYSQNFKDIKDYCKSIENKQIPLFKGLKLSNEDLIRRDVIKQLICNFYLDKIKINQLYNINFSKHFAFEIKKLTRLENDGILEQNETGIKILPKGKLLVRNVCMIFDQYLTSNHYIANSKKFSKTI